MGLPGIKREDLMVLPAGEWEKQKGTLVYEAWAGKMKVAEAGMVK